MKTPEVELYRREAREMEAPTSRYHEIKAAISSAFRGTIKLWTESIGGAASIKRR